VPVERGAFNIHTCVLIDGNIHTLMSP